MKATFEADPIPKNYVSPNVKETFEPTLFQEKVCFGQRVQNVFYFCRFYPSSSQLPYHVGVWLLPVISLLISNTVSPVRACLSICSEVSWEPKRRRSWASQCSILSGFCECEGDIWNQLSPSCPFIALRFIFLQTHATSYSFYSALLYTVKGKEENLIENHTPLPMD